jgi:hypothetical protein
VVLLLTMTLSSPPAALAPWGSFSSVASLSSMSTTAMMAAVGHRRGGEAAEAAGVAEGDNGECSLSLSLDCSAVTLASSSRDSGDGDTSAVLSNTEALFAIWRWERWMLCDAADYVVGGGIGGTVRSPFDGLLVATAADDDADDPRSVVGMTVF